MQHAAHCGFRRLREPRDGAVAAAGPRSSYREALEVEAKLAAPVGVVKAMDRLTKIEEKVSEARAAHATELSRGGVLVLRVNDGGAGASARMEVGDILLRVGPKRVEDAWTIGGLVAKVSPKQTVEIELLRGKTKRTVEVCGGPFGGPWMGDLPPRLFQRR